MKIRDIEFKTTVNWDDLYESHVYKTKHNSKGSKNSYRTDVKIKVNIPAFNRSTYRYLYLDRNGVYMRDNFYKNGEFVEKVYIPIPDSFIEKINSKIGDLYDSEKVC